MQQKVSLFAARLPAMRWKCFGFLGAYMFHVSLAFFFVYLISTQDEKKKKTRKNEDSVKWIHAFEYVQGGEAMKPKRNKEDIFVLKILVLLADERIWAGIFIACVPAHMCFH